MTWDAYNRRNQSLREVVAVADRRRDGHLPWDDVESVHTAFDSPDDLLLALQMRWHTRLRARLDAELEEHPEDLESAAARAWREAAADLPGIRAILDSHDRRPALAAARAQELAVLATVAGLGAPDDARSPALGERVRTQGQAIRLERERPPRRQSRLLRRVREALVA